MYYCKECAEKKDWPKEGRLELRVCAVCDNARQCYDTPLYMLIT